MGELVAQSERTRPAEIQAILSRLQAGVDLNFGGIKHLHAEDRHLRVRINPYIPLGHSEI